MRNWVFLYILSKRKKKSDRHLVLFTSVVIEEPSKTTVPVCGRQIQGFKYSRGVRLKSLNSDRIRK